MQTKPFSLQAPEDIAKEYGGNKQKIAKAAQMGLLDPTSAVLAGMFIDRMRGAQAQEQAPQQTVAEQTFPAPTQAPQGLAQMPAAQQMPAPQQLMPAPQQPMPAQPSPGLEQMPLSPNLLPKAAGGGLVAFAGGGEIEGYADGEYIRYSGPAFGLNAIDDPRSFYEQQRARLVTPETVNQQQFVYPLPPNTPAEDVYAAAQDRVSSGLPVLDYQTMAAFYGKDRLEEKKKELEEKAGQRFSDDVAMAMIFGGLSAAGAGQPTTGSVFGDIAQALGTAGTTVGGQIIQATKDKRAAEDKAAGMEEEYVNKQFDILSKERQNALQERQLALASGDNQLAREADERAKYYTAQMNLLAAKAQKSGSEFSIRYNNRLAQLKAEAAERGEDIKDPAVLKKLENKASTEVGLEDATAKAFFTATAGDVAYLRAKITQAQKDFETRYKEGLKTLLTNEDYQAAQINNNTEYTDKVERDLAAKIKEDVYEDNGITPDVTRAALPSEFSQLESYINRVLRETTTSKAENKDQKKAEKKGEEAGKSKVDLSSIDTSQIPNFPAGGELKLAPDGKTIQVLDKNKKVVGTLKTED